MEDINMEAGENTMDTGMSGSLKLKVSTKTLGQLETNALEIKRFVEQRLEDYTPERYDGDADRAAKDRAELNKAAETLNKDRLRLEREFMAPFQPLKDIINDTVRMINIGRDQLSVIVDARKRAERDAKQKEIEALWQDKGFSLVPLEKIQKGEWLNKTTRMSIVSSEMDDIIATVRDELETLDAFPDSDREQLKEIYLETLSLPKTVERGKALRENRERLAAEEKRKAAAAGALLQMQPCPAEDRPLIERVEVVPEEKGESAMPEGGRKASVIFTGEDLARISDLTNGMRHEPVIMVTATAEELRRLASRIKDEGIRYTKTTETVIRIDGKGERT